MAPKGHTKRQKGRLLTTIQIKKKSKIATFKGKSKLILVRNLASIKIKGMAA
jgi:hypothetical protein